MSRSINSFLNRLFGRFREKEKYAVLRIEEDRIFIDWSPRLSKKEAEHYASIKPPCVMLGLSSSDDFRKKVVSAKEFYRLRQEGVITETEMDQESEMIWFVEDHRGDS